MLGEKKEGGIGAMGLQGRRGGGSPDREIASKFI